MLITGVFFSLGHYLLPYYVAALMPPMAALCGLGFSLAWRERHRVSTRLAMALIVAASAAYALWLLPASFGVRTAVVVSTVVMAAVAIVTLGASLARGQRTTWSIQAGLVLSAGALLVSSAWASGTAVTTGLGPFDIPYEPSSVVYHSQVLPQRERNTWPRLNQEVENLPPSFSAESFEGSALAGYLIMATGKEFLPIGGFSGQVPDPSVAEFVQYVEDGRIGLVNVAVKPLTNNHVMRWVVSHCSRVTKGKSSYVSLGTTFQLFVCGPFDTGGAKGAPSPGRGPASG